MTIVKSPVEGSRAKQAVMLLSFFYVFYERFLSKLFNKTKSSWYRYWRYYYYGEACNEKREPSRCLAPDGQHSSEECRSVDDTVFDLASPGIGPRPPVPQLLTYRLLLNIFCSKMIKQHCICERGALTCGQCWRQARKKRKKVS